MVCRFFGCNVTIDTISNVCHVARNGISLKGIVDAASDLGFETASGRLSVDQLFDCPRPAILHWNRNHFVVLEHIDSHKKNFFVADPAKGHVKYTREEFENHWLSFLSEKKGIGLFLEPSNRLHDSLNTEEGNNMRSVKFLKGYIIRYRAFFIQILLGLILACILQLFMPFLTQAIVDIGIKEKQVNLIWLILLGELLIIFGRTATDFIRRWLLLHISMRINISLLSDFLIKLLRLPMGFFESRRTGDLLQRMTDHSRVQSFLTSQSLNVLFMVVSFFVFGIVLLIYDLNVFLIFMVGSAIYTLWTISFLKRRRLLDYDMFECQSLNQSSTYEFITGIQEIKLQGCGKKLRHKWEDLQADLFIIQIKLMKLQQAQETGSIFINELKNIFITVFAATSVINGSLSLGGMLAIQYIVGQLGSPVEQLMSFIFSFQEVKISLERINEVHNKNDEAKSNNLISEISNNHSIVFQDAYFRYDPHALTDTISNVNIEIPTGKVTAIVGHSGSGKTTLVKLMLGYYPLTRGKLLLGENELSLYSPDWWRSKCGVVMQEGLIFSESIMDNITSGSNEIDEDRVKHAAHIACIDTFIESLPLKYNTIIGNDGNGLSKGQKQRILIARAVYKNPPFIFLDEATNSLDAKNERHIVENLHDFYKGKTVIVVAHRLSTVRNADCIIVMDNGSVAEVGNHDELIAKRGVYYNLISNQLELAE